MNSAASAENPCNTRVKRHPPHFSILKITAFAENRDFTGLWAFLIYFIRYG